MYTAQISRAQHFMIYEQMRTILIEYCRSISFDLICFKSDPESLRFLSQTERNVFDS